MTKPLARLLGALSLALACAATVSAQSAGPGRSRATPTRLGPAQEFLSPYGLANFPAHYVEAFSALVDAQARFDAGDFVGAKGTLDALWASHPTGHPSWGNLPIRPFGLFIGSPPAYYGLRMLSDTTEWRVQHPGFTQASRTVRLTVVLAGSSSGIEPRNLQELQAGTGVPVQHPLEPALRADGSRIVHESLHLFREYVLAMTNGGLDVETRILDLPMLDVPVHAAALPGVFYAGPTNASDIWYSIPQNELAEADWWWLLYPSHVPEQYPDFQGAEFVTGGMGTGPIGRSPFFIIDDRWLVRKPPHLGSGPYSKLERDAYLPQWLAHEFFHHLFRTYPQFGLEDTPHEWFDLSNWPPDFVGRYEADYFHEALYRRLLGATPPLTSALRYATAGAPWGLFGVQDVLGAYERHPILNAWHIGMIQFGPGLEWRNQAGVEWGLQDDVANGRLLTGPDCPYFGLGWNGSKFDVVLRRDALGDLLPEIEGFLFTGELYERQ
jgi:hypothetical protein